MDTSSSGERPFDPPATSAPVRESVRFLDVQAMRRRPPPVAWLIEGLCARGALSLLAGQPKAGKSLLALALAAGVAAGEAVAGIACRPGAALVVDAENGEAEIHRRLFGLDLPARAARRLHVLEARSLDLRFDLARLERRIVDRAPDLVVLDSFRSLWSGSERSDAEVAALLGGLRQLADQRQLGILLLHHSTKGGNAYRGSNAIAAAVDLAATLSADESDPDSARRALAVFACRLGPPAEPVRLRLQSKAGRLRIEGAEPPPKSRPHRERAEGRDHRGHHRGRRLAGPSRARPKPRPRPQRGLAQKRTRGAQSRRQARGPTAPAPTPTPMAAHAHLRQLMAERER